MADLTIQSVQFEQVLAMADGLAAEGHLQLAANLYRVALKRAPKAERQRVRVRLGLVQAPSRRTQTLLKCLRELEGARLPHAFVGEGLATWQKTLPFADDETFLALADKHAGLLPLPNWHWNLSVALWAVQKAKRLDGDLVELGVFKGHTTLFCAEYVGFQDWPKRWWLYDTFEGIPEDQLPKDVWVEINRNLYQGTFSFEEVAERFAHMPNISVIKGRVPEILREGAPEHIAFLHVDLNNAPAEIAALELLFERVSPGGVILFDDYCWATTRAQYDAEKRWFEDRGLQILPLPTGQGVFVKD